MTTPAPPDAAGLLDLAALARAQRGPVPLWVESSADLHVNVLSFAAHDGVAEHVNAELDVLLVGVAGDGIVRIDSREYALRPGHALMIPKGARRAIVAGEHGLSYLSCHRRRAMLWPQARGPAALGSRQVGEAAADKEEHRDG